MEAAKNRFVKIDDSGDLQHYENVIPEQNTEQDLELKENIAYGPIVIIS